MPETVKREYAAQSKSVKQDKSTMSPTTATGSVSAGKYHGSDGKYEKGATGQTKRTSM